MNLLCSPNDLVAFRAQSRIRALGVLGSVPQGSCKIGSRNLKWSLSLSYSAPASAQLLLLSIFLSLSFSLTSTHSFTHSLTYLLIHTIFDPVLSSRPRLTVICWPELLPLYTSKSLSHVSKFTGVIRRHAFMQTISTIMQHVFVQQILANIRYKFAHLFY